MLSSIQWDLWSVWALRMMAPRLPLHPDYERSGNIDAHRFVFLKRRHLLPLVASLRRCLGSVSPRPANSRLWAGEVFLLGWYQRPSHSSAWLMQEDLKKTPWLLLIEVIALALAPDASKGGKDDKSPVECLWLQDRERNPETFIHAMDRVWCNDSSSEMSCLYIRLPTLSNLGD